MEPFENNSSSIISPKVLILLTIIVLLGVGTGFFLSKNNTGLGSVSNITTGGGSSLGKGTVVGSNDLKTFKDSTEGVLKEGGIDGEGQFHLERPGGESQSVYLTSSSVDLTQFMGKKIKVWGQTQKAQKAGWLMDVGRIEVL